MTAPTDEPTEADEPRSFRAWAATEKLQHAVIVEDGSVSALSSIPDDEGDGFVNIEGHWTVDPAEMSTMSVNWEFVVLRLPRKAVTDREPADRVDRREAEVILAGLLGGTEHATCDSCRSVMRQAHTLIVALLSRSAAEPDERCAYCDHEPAAHRSTVGEGDPLTHCRACGCGGYINADGVAEPDEEPGDG